MKGKFQWKVTVDVNSSPNRIWEIIDDISLIPQYHPEVGKVSFISGQKKRAVGVKYQCNILEGKKGSCVEEVIEYIPNVRMSTGTTEDTWGMSKMLVNFVVETTVIKQNDNLSTLVFEAYYNPVGIFNSLLNIFMLRPAMRKKSLLVMQGIKRLSELKG